MSKSPALRRIQADVRELALEPSDRYHASPLEDDMFEWHFTIRGADGTDFEGGVYHGRILLPPEYPFRPPHILFLTPSGRFETNTKICLSFSAFHPELWQPAWGIRLILEALIAFLPSPADGAIGALDWSSTERKKLAQHSQKFVCNRCGKCTDLLPKLPSNKKPASVRFQKEIEQLKLLQEQTEGNKNGENKTNDSKEEGASNQKETTEAGEVTVTDEAPSLISEAQTTDGSMIDASTKATDGHTETKMPAPTLVTGTDKETTEPQREADTAATTAEEPSHRPAHTETVDQPDVAIPDAVEEDQQSDMLWMVDPLLHAITVLMAVLCYLLARKGQALWEELKAFDHE